jgi:RHS repeat-associated protein
MSRPRRPRLNKLASSLLLALPACSWAFMITPGSYCDSTGACYSAWPTGFSPDSFNDFNFGFGSYQSTSLWGDGFAASGDDGGSCPGSGSGSSDGLNWQTPAATPASDPIDWSDDPWHDPSYDDPPSDDSWIDPWNQPGYWDPFDRSLSYGGGSDDFGDGTGSNWGGDTGLGGGNNWDDTVFDPISVRTGSVIEFQRDYRARGLMPVAFVRSYVSRPSVSVLPSIIPMGRNWRSQYDRMVIVSSDGQHAYALRGDGTSYTFTRQADGSWLAPHGIPMQLAQTASGWAFTTPRGNMERYNPDGKLVQLANRNGAAQSFAYDSSGHLASVTDPSGRSLSFAYNGNGLLASFTTSSGATYSFTYNANATLTGITYPDGRSRQYLYENAQFPTALTGIVDEAGSRVASWSYDDQGRARSNASGSSSGTVQYSAGQAVATTPLGATRTYQLSTLADGRILTTGITVGCATCSPLSTSRSFDANGFLTSVTDANGITTTFTRDAHGRETARTIAAGTAQALTLTRAWHSQFLVPTDVSMGGVTTHYDYDANGNPVRKTVSAGAATRIWQRSYNANGQLVQVVDPKGATTVRAYDAQGNLASITDPLGQVTRFTAYDADGRLLSFTDPNGLVTQYQYDARGRMVAKTAGTEITRLTWTPFGRLASVTAPDGTVRQYTYDAGHRLVQTQDSTGQRTVFTLNAAGQRTRVDVYGADGKLARSASVAYDALGRAVQSTSGQGLITSYQRDADGRLVGVTDSLGRKTTIRRDPLGRPVSSTNPLGGTTQATLDALGRITAVTDPRGVRTTYAYDPFGGLLQTTSPDAGVRTSQFDGAGWPSGSFDALNQQTLFSYDAGYRLNSVHFSDGRGATFTYDQGAYGIGHLTQVTDDSGATNWQYDAHGRVVARQIHVGSQTLSTQYAYDAAGRLVRMVYPSGAVITYTYGTDNRVQQLSVNGQVLINNITYDAAGVPVSWLYVNGQRVVRAFDLDGRQTQNSLYANTYDKGNRLTDMTPIGANAIPRSKHFGYDPLDRLNSFSDSRAPVYYQYDANSNRVAEQVGTTGNSYMVDPQSNRLNAITRSGSGNFNFTYDANGSVVQRGTLPLAYDAAGRVKSAGSTQYVYNAFGQRAMKTNLPVDDYQGDGDDADAGGDTAHRLTRLYAYGAGAEVIGEYFGNGYRLQETVYFAGQPVIVLKGSNTYFVHADQLGTPRQISDSSGKTAWTWEIATFGASAPDEYGDRLTRFSYNLRFPGQYYDSETGLHYNWHRYYDPQTGRYLQSDPIGLAGGSNPYRYADANPTGEIDSTGLWGAIFPNIDLSYYLGGGGSFGGGLYASPDEGSAGAYHYTATGGGLSAGLTLGVGFFVGSGTSMLDGDGQFFNVALGPISINVGTSGGQFASFQIGLALGSPDIFLAGAVAGNSKTTLHPAIGGHRSSSASAPQMCMRP